MTIVRYQYKDPKEMTAFKVINEGEGFFKILEIVSKTSKSGNQMLVMTCKLRDTSGNETLYNHYLIYNEWLAENMWRICEAVGKPEAYSDGGTNTDDLLGCAGRCKIKTENKEFGQSSVIHRFIPYKPMREEAELEVAQPEIDDQIPF